jgi:putative cardiolipin synthase
VLRSKDRLLRGRIRPRLRAPLPATSAVEGAPETRLGGAVADLCAEHPGLSGVRVLQRGTDAFAARVALIDMAERAIDLQVYILQADVTGRWILARLLAAADRGVRVRLLLDDLGTTGVDDLLAAVDAHPNVDVRLFNPFARGRLGRISRVLDGLMRFGRLNHRMHNKLLSVDGAAAVVGGRNVGDEYFDAHERVNFADVDLLAVGPVVRELGESFDLFWNCAHSVPVSAWSALRADAGRARRVHAELAEHARASEASAYGERLLASDVALAALSSRSSLTWAPVRAVADRPEKVTVRGRRRRAALLTTRLGELVPIPAREMLIVSAYFVPRRRGTRRLAELARGGVRVRVLTNALAATDVAAVHAGYQRSRWPLLATGAEPYELRPRGAAVLEAEKRGLLGSSSASLHAKTFAIDGRVLFVGSLNLDPRSVALNTEIGLVVESAELCAGFARRFEDVTGPRASWSLALEPGRPRGRVTWTGEEDGRRVQHRADPETTLARRLLVRLLGLLPIEGQL